MAVRFAGGGAAAQIALPLPTPLLLLAPLPSPLQLWLRREEGVVGLPGAYHPSVAGGRLPV